MEVFKDIENDPFDFTKFINWLGLLGNIFAIIFFIAPISLMVKLHKKEIDPAKIPYLIMIMNVMNCFLWFSYGILIDDFFVMLANGIGYPTNLIYLCLFLFYKSDRNCLKSMSFILPSIIVSGGVFALLAFLIKNENVSKFSAMVFNIFMYGAPGQNILQVLKTEDFTLIPLPSTILAFFCSLTWFFYGILKGDISIIIPNGLGVLFSIINLGTYFHFYKKKKNGPLLDDMDNKENKLFDGKTSA